MDLLEYQGKQLFARHGVPVPDGRPAQTVDEAVVAADEIGYPCVVKAQVQIGGRGKAGGIKVASDQTEAREHAQAILGMDIRGLTVHELWIERASEIDAEYYASVIFDRSAKAPLVMLSTKGGMDIEQVAEEDPQAIARLHVDPLVGFQAFHGRRLCFEAGVAGDVIRPVGALLAKLYDVFIAEEATLVEVNPLIVTPGGAGVGDAAAGVGAAKAGVGAAAAGVGTAKAGAGAAAAGVGPASAGEGAAKAGEDGAKAGVGTAKAGDGAKAGAAGANAGARQVKALDAKVTLDDNALFRHPENAQLRDVSAEDPQERMAKERGLTYVKLDGDIGILGNGAGLVMSTLDVVAQAGGSPANFLDAGGGAKAEAITSAVEVILSNPKVKAVLFNIFGGITRGEEVANGLIEAFAQIKPQVPFVVRLDGTNSEEGRRMLQEANLPNVVSETTMDGAAQRVVELARAA